MSDCFEHGPRLLKPGAAGESETINLMLNGIAQATDAMNNTGCARAHGQHLTDAAGFIAARHEEQIAKNI
jgi:hypothetical protein